MAFARLWQRCALALLTSGLIGLAHGDPPAGAGREFEVQPPEAAGFSSQRLQRIDELMQRLTDSKQLAGIVTLAARHGKCGHFKTFGPPPRATEKPMPRDAIFRIYSMTKPVIGVAMMILYEEGRWQP